MYSFCCELTSSNMMSKKAHTSSMISYIELSDNMLGYLVLFKGLHTIFEVKKLEGFMFHPHFQYLSQCVIVYFFDQLILVC